MSKSKAQEFLKVSAFVAFIIIAGLLIFASIKNDGGITTPNQYANTNLPISFDYPSSLVINEEDAGAGIYIINLTPINSQGTSDVISLTDMRIGSKIDVVEAAASYLEVDKNKIVKVNSSDISEARYVKYGAGGEVSFYNFYKNGSRFDIVRFNQKVYDQRNPIILMDNSHYNFAYTKILSTLSLSPKS